MVGAKEVAGKGVVAPGVVARVAAATDTEICSVEESQGG